MGAFEEQQRKNVAKQLAAGAITQEQADRALAGIGQAEAIIAGGGRATYGGEQSGVTVYQEPSRSATPTRTTTRTPNSQSAQRQSTSSQSFSLQDVANLISGISGQHKPPEITRLSREEMMTQAQNLANLQIDPLISALTRGKDDYLLGYDQSVRNIEAAYAGVPAETDRLLTQAREAGTESAIARGGGRSGAVEYGVAKLQEPVMLKATQLAGEKAAKLANLEEGKDLFEKQFGGQVAELEGRRGQVTTAIFDQLSREDQQIALGLAGISQSNRTADTQALLGLLPYFANTRYQDDQLTQSWTGIMGQTPDYPAGQTVSMGSLDSIVGLRDYAEGAGVGVGWDSATGNVTIGSQSFTPTQLRSMGGRLINDRWQIPQSAIDGLLYGGR